MKPLHSLLAVLFLGTAAAFSQDGAGVSVDFFHDNLQAYGDWREVGDLGYCWQPRNVDPAWRPYSDGRWLYTDAGWTWDSEDPYSWAVFHYGRWARIDRVGWVWVPGTEWSPAWVSWRSDGSRVGWAPLPPDAVFDRGVGLDGQVDAEYDIGPSNYNFVESRNFGAPRLSTVLIDPRENITLFSQSRNITSITYVNDTVFNGGPEYDVISRESTQAIPRLKLERQQGLGNPTGPAATAALQSRVIGNSLRVAAIPFDARPATAPRKVAAKVEAAALDHGWKNAGPPAEVAKLRARVKSDAASQTGTRGPKGAATAPAPAVSPVPAETSPRNTPIAARPTGRTDAEVGRPGLAPPANVGTAAGSPPKKGVVTGGETPHPAVGTFPNEEKKGRKPKSDPVERPANAPPTAVTTPPVKTHSEKGEAPPKSEKAAAPLPEHTVPLVPEPRPQTKKPEPHEPIAPAANQPSPTKGKSKEKGKDDPKDAPKPPGPGQ